MIEQKKAEKDAPGWITPTLLNGWAAFNADVYPSARFYKDSMGIVHLDGIIAGGVVTGGSNIFVLPIGYRPKSRMLVTVPVSLSESPFYAEAHLIISFSGVIQIYNCPGNLYLSLSNISFLGE
ncbi:hypothetical protein D3C73_1121930 [compost metagenome]